MLNKVWAEIWQFFNSQEFTAQVTSNRFWLILLVVVLVHLNLKTYRSLWLCALINIPGTFLHEFMHLIVGGFMNAEPTKISIFPKRGSDGSYVLGAVEFKNITFYNAAPAALAPLFLLPIGFYINRYLLPLMPVSLGNYVLYVLLQTVIIQNAIPSETDLRIAFKYWGGILMYAILAVAVASLFL